MSEPLIKTSAYNENIENHPVLKRRKQAINHSRLGWGIVLLGFFGFVLWASLAPLDRGVVVEGSVMVAGYRKAVQHPSGGVVQHIHVTDGDHVEVGQTLFTLDQNVVQAQALTSESQYLMSLAKEARLKAEQMAEQERAVQVTAVPFPSDLDESVISTPLVASYINASKQLQQTLYTSRRQSYYSELNVLNEKLEGAQSRLNGLLNIQESQETRSHLMRERIAGMEELAQQDFIPKNRLLEVQESYGSLLVEIQRSLNDIESTKRSINEARSNIQLRKTSYQQEVNSELAELQEILKSQYQRMIETKTVLEQSEIKSPVSGIIVNMSAHTIGGVVRPADTLLEVVPENQPLIVEARFPLESIDSLALHQNVDIMFTAFNRSQTPKVTGEVTYISADKLIDEATQMPYYAGRINVSSQSLSELNGLTILPGMPVQAFVQNGERTLISYLFKPFIDRMPLALAGGE